VPIEKRGAKESQRKEKRRRKRRAELPGVQTNEGAGWKECSRREEVDVVLVKGERRGFPRCLLKLGFALTLAEDRLSIREERFCGEGQSVS